MPRALLNLAYLAIFAVAALALILVLGLIDLAVEGPAKALVGWIGQTFGPWAIVVMIVGLASIGYGSAYLSHRRDQRQQYERDRTIHVLPKKPLTQGQWLYIVLMGGMVVTVVLAETFK